MYNKELKKNKYLQPSGHTPHCSNKYKLTPLNKDSQPAPLPYGEEQIHIQHLTFSHKHQV